MKLSQIKDIYDLIHSKDLREYCRSIKHEFTNGEKYCLINSFDDKNNKELNKLQKFILRKKFKVKKFKTDYSKQQPLSYSNIKYPKLFKKGDIITFTYDGCKNIEYGMVLTEDSTIEKLFCSDIAIILKDSENEITIECCSPEQIEYYRGEKNKKFINNVEEFYRYL